VLIKEVHLGSCPSTDILKGLNKQLIQQLDKIAPGKLVSIKDLSDEGLIKLGSAANPFVGGPTAKARLKRAIESRGETLKVNSAYRTVAQQFLLGRIFHFGPPNNCGMAAVADPGTSNHESGLALDIQDPFSWKLSLQTFGWKHLGPFDPPHYDFVGGTDLRKFGVMAFQSLWNQHNPHDKLEEPVDGLFGPETRKRLEKTPIDGF
jgi:hypothetical protein